MLTNPPFYPVVLSAIAWVMYGLCMENKEATYNRKTLALALFCNGGMAFVTFYCYHVSLHKQVSHPTLLVYACIVWATCALRSAIAFWQIGRVRKPSEWSFIGVVLIGLVSMPVLALPFLA